MKKHERNAGDGDKKDENDLQYSKELAQLDTRTRILESRSYRFQVKALEKYKELQIKLNNDPRLSALIRNE